MKKNDTLAAYSDFTKWCRDNPHLDLDSRPHSHGGPIGDGGYISDEKTRVAFAAWRAALESPEVQALQFDLEQYVSIASELATENEALRVALEMIAGMRPCPDSLMGNADIARAALAQNQGE